MLQSPKVRIQRQPRRPSENPILEAKQDPQRRIQRPSARPIAPNAVTQRVAPRKQQHRRYLLVPDNVLMSIASASAEGGVHSDFKLYQANELSMGGSSTHDASGHRPTETADANNNFFLQLQPQKLDPSQAQLDTKSTVQNQFPDFMTANQDDAAGMIDDLFSFENYTHGRRGSAPQPSFCAESSMKGNSPRAATFPQQSSALPTPPQSGPMQCLSPFDLAPLPSATFVNLATLSIPLENDVESYFSPRSALASPTFPPVQTPATIQPAGLFENTISMVTENSFSSESDAIKGPHLSENTTFDIVEMRHERDESPLQPLGAKATGISMEEIASFIAGPEPSDGKWVCKYPECEKRFGRKENIKSHVQTHLGDRQYQCMVCKKCFVRQHDLKRHSKIHTGIKPYPCLCGNSFARHDALTRHRQRGMCIGAFEGIVKKVAKRGRPRKKPLNEEGSEPTKKCKNTDKSSDRESSSSSFSSSSSGSDVSDPRTPTALDCASPPPDTPNFDQYDSSSSTTGRSVKEESPELLPYSLDSDYTPPTSPPDFCEVEDFTPKADYSKRNSYASGSIPDEDFHNHELDYSELGCPMPGSDSGKCGSEYSSDDFSQVSVHGDEFMFSQDGLDMFNLSTLERDPSILGLGGEDIYIKPELLSNP